MNDPRFARVVAALSDALASGTPSAAPRGEAGRPPSYYSGGFAAQAPGAVMGRAGPEDFDLGSLYVESVDGHRSGDRRRLALGLAISAAICGAWVALWRALDNPWVSIPAGIVSTVVTVAGLLS